MAAASDTAVNGVSVRVVGPENAPLFLALPGMGQMPGSPSWMGAATILASGPAPWRCLLPDPNSNAKSAASSGKDGKKYMDTVIQLPDSNREIMTDFTIFSLAGKTAQSSTTSNAAPAVAAESAVRTTFNQKTKNKSMKKKYYKIFKSKV